MRTVFEYQNYREFLRDYYADEKRRKTGLTYAKFSARAGVKSPNLLKQVVDGVKNLTSENAQRFARAIGLWGHEIDFFEALVSFNQAKRAEERDFFDARLRRVRERMEGFSADTRQLSNQEFELISDWKYWAIMTLTMVPGFEERGSWISERLDHVIPPKEAERMLAKLIQYGLVSRSENGKLTQTNKQVQTRPEVGKTLARVFYDGLFHQASMSLKTLEPDEREFGCYISRLSEKQLPELKRKIREFLKELYLWASEDAEAAQVYALQFGAFPLTFPEKGVR